MTLKIYGAQERVDKNSLWAVLTPLGHCRVATRPNSAVGIVCESRIGSCPGWDKVRYMKCVTELTLEIYGAQERVD